MGRIRCAIRQPCTFVFSSSLPPSRGAAAKADASRGRLQVRAGGGNAFVPGIETTPSGDGGAPGETGSQMAASRDSRVCFASTPPTYWPIDPSLRTTRWQGTTIGIGLVAHAVPTARTAFGLPDATAMAA